MSICSWLINEKHSFSFSTAKPTLLRDLCNRRALSALSFNPLIQKLVNREIELPMDITTGAISPLIQKLNDLLIGEFMLEKGLRKSIESLLPELTKMHTILHTVARVRPEQLDDGIEIWGQRVRWFSYKMVDIVDPFMVHVEDGGDSATPKNRVKELLKKSMKLFKKGEDLHQISNAMEEAIHHAKQLAELRQRYEQEIVHDTRFTAYVDPRLMALYTDVTELIGIEDSREKLINMLTEGDDWSKQLLKTVSIVGFGGLGKTTLAKAAYDKIKVQFDCGAFVSASQNPDMKKVSKDILYQLDKEKYMYIHDKAQHEKELMDELIGFLNGKRYLIVIDDIWDKEVWELINYAFSGNNSLGSRIITTTRIVSVSEACCSSVNDSVYYMEPLSDDESKKLLCDRLFGSVSRCPHEFKQVSSDILKKCGGVPLAIIAMTSVLARHLSIKPKDEWHVLLKSIGREHANERCWKDMEKILSFSYYDLPSHLKTCLLYLSCHPIERGRLVKKLIAEGIVSENCKTHDPSLGEEVASKYLDELVNRNVIHLLKCNNNGEVITYHIHPMMHDVLKAIAIEQEYAASLNDKDISSAQSMSFTNLFIDCPANLENLIDPSSKEAHRVRSLTICGHANGILLRYFKDIRVLDLEGCKSIERADLEYICSMVLLKRLCLAKTQITELPPQIGKLQYLEELDVGGTQITQLPTQIGKLQHLKRLDARKSGVKEVSDHVLQLTRLVHLLIGDSESCEGVKLPDGIGKMTSLQQLCTIDLRKCSVSSLKELGSLPYLKEIAVVSSDEQEDTRMNNALFCSLNKSIRQRPLALYSDFRLSTVPSSSGNKYLDYWKKHTVLRFLKVPTDFAGQHLGMLDIRVCKLEEGDLKILGEMPRLRSLIVRLEVLLTKLIHISCEGFAQLERFCVDCRMPRVIFEEGAMPKLDRLELKLYAGSTSEEHMGIKHLLNLQKVTLWYAKWYATNKGVRKTTEALKTECKEHQNEITLCIAEEGKGDNCTMKNEIFQENIVASCSRMAEIEEEEEDDGHVDETGCFLNRGDNAQEGDLHQSSRDIASCSGTCEIKEVVE